jgi:hypothetical protein
MSLNRRWRRVHEDASQDMYMSKIEIFFFTARILQNQRMLSRLETCIVYCKKENFNFWHVHILRSVFVNSPPPKPEVILTNFFAEPTVLLVPITSRDIEHLQEPLFKYWRRVHEDASQGMYMSKIEISFLLLKYCKIRECYAVANAFTIRNMYSFSWDDCFCESYTSYTRINYTCF